MVLDKESTSDGDTVMVIKMATKDLVDYVNLVEKGVAGFDIIHFNFENSVGKMLSNRIVCYKEIIPKSQ